MRRRLLFALAPLALLVAGTEALGRLRADPHATDGVRLYEPGVALVRTSGTTVETARPELHPQRWQLPAPGFRVAFVGDSTVWGQLPDAFAQGVRVSDQPVEVLNFGIRGAASDRARIAATTATQQDLDLLVVYVGHNEVTEARLNPFSLRPFWQRRLSSALLHSGTGRLLGGLLAPVRTQPDALSARGDAAASPLTQEEWAPVAASYRANLAAICDLGVPTLFVEPISSLVNPGAAPDGAAPDLRSAMWTGYAAAREGNAEGALAWGERLRGYYPDFGPPHALRGVALLGLGRRDEALPELREARRRDAQPARATEDHWEILRSVASACGATTVSTEPGFLADPRYLDAADPLFMDRVHPTLPGNVLLASIIAGAIPDATFDPALVTLTPPADEAARGWKVEERP